MADEKVEVAVLPGADLTSAQASSEEGVPIMVEVIPPEGTARTPVDICLVVDVSGSMGAEATLQNDAGQEAGHGLSVLDVVKHALKTIIRNLGDHDRLAIVSYANAAEMVLPLTNSRDKNALEDRLTQLRPEGMTNLWDGLKKALEEMQAKREPGRLQHIMLFTDGLPNINPPRGIVPMLKRLKDKEPGKRLGSTISTFGFGYELDSDLLSTLAIEGSGSYAFIPDAGFVGTVFVNAMANLMVTMGRNVELTLKPKNGASIKGFFGGHPVLANSAEGTTLSLGTLQFGQPDAVVVNMQVPAGAVDAGYLDVQVQYMTKTKIAEPETVTMTAQGNQIAPEVESDLIRLTAVDTLRKCMQMVKISAAQKMQGVTMPLTDAQDTIADVVDQINDSEAKESLVGLKEDLTGQVTEAFTKEEWYHKWGVHFIPSLMFAHLQKQCNNFKDAGVQNYGGELFRNLRDAADEIFISLPAPTPTIPPPPPPAPTPSARAAAPPVHVPVRAPVSMAAFHNSYGGCFDGDCLVTMADGSRRRAADIRKGDLLAGALQGSKASEVVCSVRTVAPEGRFPMVSLEGGLRITAYHPIQVEGTWQFPCEQAEIEEQQCDAVFTFLLKEGGSAVEVEGVACSALGHGLTQGAAAHPYYSSHEAVLKDLQRFPGFAAGMVDLRAGSIRRDPQTGMVCGMEP